MAKLAFTTQANAKPHRTFLVDTTRVPSDQSWHCSKPGSPGGTGNWMCPGEATVSDQIQCKVCLHIFKSAYADGRKHLMSLFLIPPPPHTHTHVPHPNPPPLMHHAHTIHRGEAHHYNLQTYRPAPRIPRKPMPSVFGEGMPRCVVFASSWVAS